MSPDAAESSRLRRVLARVRRLHSDRRAQLMPLVFAMGLAFFTSVIFVVNTGRADTSQIRAQNAIDAAAVSSTSVMARGMNYLAENNISTAKLLATVALLRAFDGAIADAQSTLNVLWIAAQALKATGYGFAIGQALELKIRLERESPIFGLEAMRGLYTQASLWWDKQPGESRGNESGLAWIALRALSDLSDLLYSYTPILAQGTARAVFRRDVGDEEAQTMLLPVNFHLPVCQGRFVELHSRVRDYAQEWSEPIRRFGRYWLTLSMFEFHYQSHLRSELNEMFTGSSIPPADEDPDESAFRRGPERLKELEDRIKDAEQRIAESDDPETIATLRKVIRNAERESEDIKKDLEKRSNRRMDKDAGQAPPKGWTSKLGGLQGSAQDRTDVYPYRIDPTGWPATYSYPVLGMRRLPAPIAPAVYGRVAPDGDGLVFASGRLFNSIRADLWTPAWRAKLVRTRSDYLVPTSPESPGCELTKGMLANIGPSAALNYELGGEAAMLLRVAALKLVVDDVGKH